MHSMSLVLPAQNDPLEVLRTCRWGRGGILWALVHSCGGFHRTNNVVPTARNWGKPALSIANFTAHRHGQGTMTYAHGDIYEGLWKNDQKHGCGTRYLIEKGKR